MKLNITNPIYFELKKLNLLKKKHLRLISSKTRDNNIKVFRDIKSKIIFLEKCITSDKYYNNVKYLKSDTVTSNKTIRSLELKDVIRRANQFKNMCKNKHVLDFGCGWGEFLTKIKNAKSLNGVELGKQYFKKISSQNLNINLKSSINDFSFKFDLVTMFHVLEHIPYQIKILKQIRNKIKKKVI